MRGHTPLHDAAWVSCPDGGRALAMCTRGVHFTRSTVKQWGSAESCVQLVEPHEDVALGLGRGQAAQAFVEPRSREEVVSRRGTSGAGLHERLEPSQKVLLGEAHGFGGPLARAQGVGATVGSWWGKVPTVAPTPWARR